VRRGTGKALAGKSFENTPGRKTREKTGSPLIAYEVRKKNRWFTWQTDGRERGERERAEKNPKPEMKRNDSMQTKGEVDSVHLKSAKAVYA